MHLTVQLHVPVEGRYDDFDGNLRLVEQFTTLAGAPVAANAAGNADRTSQIVCDPFAAPPQGGSPVEVQLPVSGKVFLLEKILSVKDVPWFSYAFSGLRR
jgi:hypothetical protein